MERKYVISPEATVREAIARIDEEGIGAVVVADEADYVLGIFSQGDMRRYFLRGGDLSSSITKAMNRSPVLFHSLYEAKNYEKRLIIYPIIDEAGRILNVWVKGEEGRSDSLKEVPVVIMAGGKGTRLRPYTNILPKALIPVGDLTITERIINSFREFGCHNFHMILNHKASMIRAYFSELEKDYCIHYYKEDQFLGTGGGLTYLRGSIDQPFFLSNCDILINADLECIYKTHKMQGNVITFVCAMKNVVIPYGVIENDDHGEVLNFLEKPAFSFLTNTGVYVLEPEVINDLKEGEFIHMPEIAQRYMAAGKKVGVFPISEKSWMDMGQFSELESMLSNLGV